MYNYLDYPTFNKLAISQWRTVNRLRPNATRKRRKAYSMGLRADYINACELKDGSPIGKSAVHMVTVHLGTGGFYEPIQEVQITKSIVRLSEHYAFDIDGRRYLTRCIIGYTDALDREVTPYDITRAGHEKLGSKAERCKP